LSTASTKSSNPALVPRCDDRLNGGGIDRINCGPGREGVIKDRADVAVRCERTG